jgi:hypothetical protein
MLAPVTAGAERRWIPGQLDDSRGATREHVDVAWVWLIASTFLLGWVSGVLMVWKAWQLFHASHWLMIGGAGYVALMLIPIMCGFGCARVAGRLASRGWGRAPLRALALGVCGLVAGLMAI